MSQWTWAARLLLVGSALTLAGCQGLPLGSSPGFQASDTVTTLRGRHVTSTAPQQPVTPSRTAEQLRVFLSDTHPHAGWVPVHLKPSGELYVRTEAIIDRRDLVGIQSATDQAGGGILVLILSREGLRKIREATANHPGLRLALVVGQTMLAAPGYTAPVREQQLAFGVGSAHNAEVAARAVAGVQ
ncbi:MAG TPA: hypothetical protein VF285_13175 [Castellaniella sp.]|uniref:hypothetical protein n=1 Tax=Castellaniella sp. TaxID=1955812 RepID=UPI002EEF42E5